MASTVAAWIIDVCLAEEAIQVVFREGGELAWVIAFHFSMLLVVCFLLYAQYRP